jgi:hypothetical protein
MKNIAGRITVLAAVLISLHPVAGAQDTLFRYYPEFTSYYLIDHPDSAIAIDTSMSHFNRFHPAEIPFGWMHAGYLGGAAQPMFLVNPDEVDVDIGLHSFDIYLRDAAKVRLYDTRQPYTSFAYQQGTNSEIRTNILNAQNITPSFSFGADFNRNRTDGMYARQVSKLSNFNTFLRYTTPDNRYRGTLIYLLNDFKLEQNGGVTNDSIFESEGFFNRAVVPVALQFAETRWKTDELAATNSIHFGKKVLTSSKTDTVERYKIVPHFRLQQRISWEHRTYRFNDELGDSSFYSDPELFPDAGIRDSIAYHRIMNEFRLSKFKDDSADHRVNFTANAFFRHTFWDIQNKSLSHDFQSVIIGGDVSASIVKKVFAIADAKLNVAGRNQGDFTIKGWATWRINEVRNLAGEIVLGSIHQSLMAEQYESSYFNWNHDFDASTVTTFVGVYHDARWKLTVKGTWLSHSNYVYWNAGGEPVLYDKTLTGYQFFLLKNFAFKWFHFDNEILYQSYSNDSVVAFPAFLWRTSLYYQSHVFQKALQVKAGIDLTYRSTYHAPGYNPAVGQFFIQLEEDISWFPAVDIFVTLKVRSLRAFVMFQNVNQDLGYKGNFTAYRYPMPDRTFKIGFQWLFWN